MAEKDQIVEMQGIFKNFPGVKALDNVDFDLGKGEIHVLVGENGAGKSTLVKILAGVLPLDHGNILIDGAPVRIGNPSRAQQLGIGIVFQESNLSPYLTVAQNIYIRHEPLRAGFVVDVKEETRKARELLQSLSMDIDPNELVANISIGKRQLVAFARALSFNPRVIILDEPTSSLTAQETELMFSVLKKLKKEGVGIIYISHRLEELFQIGDRITVLRDGKVIDTLSIKSAQLNTIISMMVGRDISEMYPKEATQIGEEAFRLEKVTRKGICKEIDLSIHKGEVVGLYGLVGAGRTETMRMAFGLDAMESGSVFLYGEKIDRPSPSKLVSKGIGFSPEDRKQEGLCLALSLKENIVRASLDRLFTSGFISGKRENEIAQQYIHDLNIATPSVDRLALYLSGGTQQKVVLAQWLCAKSLILILDEPTRGIDVGTKVEIYRMINQLAQNGTAILVISSELPEVMGISDRIYVMCRGEITGKLDHADATAEKIAALAFGTQEAIHATKS
ncbi:MAG: sugar ABC transporter ATP-binding protein [Anaerolineaceae bacterium]